MNKSRTANVKAFTVLEVILVIVVIAILAAIVYIAINPAKNFSESRNAQRSANVNAILSGLW